MLISFFQNRLNKPFLLFLFSLHFSVAAKGNQQPPNRQLVWEENFSVDGMPDDKHWSYEEGYIRNGELQYYTSANPRNSRIKDGFLIIEAHKEEKSSGVSQNNSLQSSFFLKIFPFLNNKEKTHKYTSASLITKDKLSFTHARIEVRAKLPEGRGVWPAIWLLGNNISEVGWPECGEIDIMEFVGYDPSKTHSAIHTNYQNHQNNNSPVSSVMLPYSTSGFHTYSVDWDYNSIRFYIDDQLHFTYKKLSNTIDKWPFDQPMYLILNLAIGGGWGGKKGVDDSIFPQQFIIDFVRVYQ